MTIRPCFAVLLAILLVGCDKWPTGKSQSTPSPAPGWRVESRGEERQSSTPNDSHPYQLHAASGGKMFRLDTQTGQTSLVTEKGLTNLPDNRRVQLRVGEIYTLENEKSAIYEGNEKLNSDTRRIADALVEKYLDKSSVDKGSKPRAEPGAEGRPIPPPPPGFILLDKK